jgi:signal transduction histidine kinase
LENVIYESEFGKIECYPDCKIDMQIVNQANIYNCNHAIVVTRTEQWLKVIKELKSDSAIQKSTLTFKARDWIKKIYSSVEECYVAMITSFERFYESSSTQPLATLMAKSKKEKKISAFLEGPHKDLINNAADSVAERLGDELAPAELAIEISMKAGNGQFILTIKDAGRGLTAERAALINTNSFVSDKAEKRWLLGGKGRGLKDARREAAIGDGKIEIESKGLNQGASTKLSIPLM